jgi:hypothetical protein
MVMIGVRLNNVIRYLVARSVCGGFVGYRAVTEPISRLRR